MPGTVLSTLCILPHISSSQKYFAVGVGSNLSSSGFMFPRGRISIRIKLLASCSPLQSPWGQSLTSLACYEEGTRRIWLSRIQDHSSICLLKKGCALFCCWVSPWAEWSGSAPGERPVFPCLPVPSECVWCWGTGLGNTSFLKHPSFQTVLLVVKQHFDIHPSNFCPFSYSNLYGEDGKVFVIF